MFQPSQATPADEARKPGATRHITRVGLLLSGIGVAAILLWIATAPLDEGVPAQGSVVVDTKRKAVQHATGGIVREVLVGEGSTVSEGQPLLRLDSAQAQANYQAIRQRYLGLRAMEARLVAERDSLGIMKPHADLQAARSDALIQVQWQTQQQLLGSRRSALEAELAGIEESRQAQLVSIDAFKSMQTSRQRQLSLLQEEHGQTRGLVQEGYAPRNRQLELERMMAETQSSLAEIEGNILRARRSTAELGQRVTQRRGEYRKEVSTDLAEVLREVEADMEKLKAAREELDRTEIRAPVGGQVVGLAIQSVGAVIQPAQKIADVVPAGESLLLEARVPLHLIDRVHEGLPVDVRFNGFAHSPQLVVDARVKSVSADILNDPATQQSYYLARVTVTPEGLKTLGNRQLQPGMPVEVVFRTGERTVLTYLLHPLVKRLSASMKEE